MSVHAHDFIGQNNSSTPAEVISNIFVDYAQARLDTLPQDSDYGLSHGTSLIRIKADTKAWQFGNSGINPAIMTQLQIPVYGILKDEFTYSLASEWETIELPSILDVKAFADMVAYTGGGSIGSVARSEKFWKRSGDIKLNPTFRILDVEGNGAAIKMVHILLLMTASVGSQTVEGLAGAVDTLAGGVQDIANTLAGTLQGAGDASGATGLAAGAITIGTTYIEVAGAGLGKFLKNAKDFATLRACPPPVDVQIGKLFRHKDMVITELSVVFSKECTAAGPIWADVTLALVTRKIIADITEVGLAAKGLLGVNANPSPNEYSNISVDFNIDRMTVVPQTAPGAVTVEQLAEQPNALQGLNYQAGPQKGPPWADLSTATPAGSVALGGSTQPTNYVMKQV